MPDLPLPELTQAAAAPVCVALGAGINFARLAPLTGRDSAAHIILLQSCRAGLAFVPALGRHDSSNT